MRAFNQGGMKRARPLLPAVLLASTMLTAAGAARADDPKDKGLGEVIVTAQKREENLQNVPISVQALGAVKLDQLHITNFNDYIKYLPSVSYQTFGPGSSNVFMRGVAADNQSNHSGSQPSVGTYLDEQPITTVGGALDIHVYDIARVESLAGPQGTLYGASSMAGTIRIITNKPDSHGFSAGYDLQGNQVDHGSAGYVAEGFVNIPVMQDKAAVRLVGWAEHDGGYIDNVPGTRTFSTGIMVNNAAFVKNNYNSVDTYGGRAALKIDLDNNWTVTPMVIAQDERNNGIFAYDPSVGDLKVSHFRPESQHDRWYQASLTIQGKISDFDILYSGGYMDRRIDTQSDYTDYSYFYDKLFGYAAYFTNNSGNYIDPTQAIIGKDHFTKDSHELRISSPQGNKFRFVAGLFYQDQQHYILQDYVIKDLATSLSVTNWPGTYWLTDQLRTDRDYAAFTEASYDVTDKLTVTAGIRAYKATSTLEGFYGFSANVSSHTGEAKCFISTPIVGNGPCTNLDKHSSDTGETHKINATYHLDSNKLIYATYSTGFRPGGANRNGNLAPYKPDFLSNYEIGWKTSWADNTVRWNGALFDEEWKNFQFSYLGPNSLTVVNNAGNARVLGVESDLTWRPMHGLTFTGAGTFTDAHLLQDFCNGAPVCNAGNTTAPKGQQLPVTPKFKANLTARYEWDINDIKAHLQGAVVYQGDSWSDLLTADRQTLGVQQAYTTADFTAGLAKNNWTLELSILNAFDTRAQMYRYAECTIAVCGAESYVLPNRPRTIGLKWGQKF